MPKLRSECRKADSAANQSFEVKLWAGVDAPRSNGDFSTYGQNLSYTTRRVAKMNLAIGEIDAPIVHGRD